jgi:hypothetical protein
MPPSSRNEIAKWRDEVMELFVMCDVSRQESREHKEMDQNCGEKLGTHLYFLPSPLMG